jgi:hypothetical protein
MTYDPKTQRVIEGLEAWKSLRDGDDETWEKWIALGRAIDTVRKAIMRRHTDQPKGQSEFDRWLIASGFDEFPKGMRRSLQTCVENLRKIEAWRQTLDPTLRSQLNRPDVVLRRWQKATKRQPLSKSARTDIFRRGHRLPGSAYSRNG